MYLYAPAHSNCVSIENGEFVLYMYIYAACCSVLQCVALCCSVLQCSIENDEFVLYIYTYINTYTADCR